MAFEDLPRPIRHPERVVDDQPQSEAEVPRHIPDDDWPTFRAAYRELWSEGESQTCDAIYVDTMCAVLGSEPESPDDLAAILGLNRPGESGGWV